MKKLTKNGPFFRQIIFHKTIVTPAEIIIRKMKIKKDDFNYLFLLC
jgi:hypothetical protein